MLEYEWGNAAPNIFTGDDETNNNPITPTTTTPHHHHSDHLNHSNRYIFDPFSSNNHINFNDPNNTTTCTPLLIPSSSSSTSSSPYYNNGTTSTPYNFYNQNTQLIHSFPSPDPRLNFYHPTPNINISPSMLSLETLTHSQLEPNNYNIPPVPLMLPKQEPYTCHMQADYNSTHTTSTTTTSNNNNNNRIGLNLGGRTYFSASDDHDFVNRLYRRGGGGNGRGGGYNGDHHHQHHQGGGGLGNSGGARCQAEGCNADLSNSKHYHRRHKVCEFHSKASTVIAAGLTQRFCQQCSRFHLLNEFDNGKRSCRRRLADHNRRRRKSNQIISSTTTTSTQDSRSDHHNSRSKSETLERSPSDSGIHSSSSVTVAVSPPRMSLDSFKQSCTRPSSYNVLMMGGGTGTTTSTATNGSASSTSLFYSS